MLKKVGNKIQLALLSVISYYTLWIAIQTVNQCSKKGLYQGEIPNDSM